MKFNTSRLDQYMGEIEKDKEKRAKFREEMKARRESMNQLYQDNLGYIIGNSDRMKSLLAIASRFHDETLKNIVLIHAQNPDAVCVKPKYLWNKLRARLPSEDKAIWIFTPGKKAWVNGAKSGVYWNPTEAYDAMDVSRVDVKTNVHTRDPSQVFAALVKAVGTKEEQESNGPQKDDRHTPVVFRISENQDEVAHYDPSTNTMTMRRDASPQERCEAAILELCHRELFLNGREGNRRTIREQFEAYAAAYLVCCRAGITPEDTEFPTESFTAKSPQEFETELRWILRASSWLGDKLDTELVKMDQEQRVHSVPAKTDFEKAKEG